MLEILRMLEAQLGAANVFPCRMMSKKKQASTGLLVNHFLVETLGPQKVPMCLLLLCSFAAVAVSARTKRLW